MAEHERIMGILLPGSFADLKRRYRILRYLDTNGRSGRRALHQALSIPERRLRDDVHMLTCAQLIEHRAGGASISAQGRKLLSDFPKVFPDLVRCCDLEEQLGCLLPAHRFIVYPDYMEMVEEARTAGRITDWKQDLDPEEQKRLLWKDPCCEAGGWILDIRGKPVFHRYIAEEPPMFFAGTGISAGMILPVLRFYKTCGICLFAEAAGALAANLQK